MAIVAEEMSSEERDELFFCSITSFVYPAMRCGPLFYHAMRSVMLELEGKMCD